MQLTLVLGGKAPISLPVHYTGLVQGLLYEVMQSPALKSYLHDHGFLYGNRRFKLFTFSRLLSRKVSFDPQTKHLRLQPPIRLVVCSPVAFILQEIGTGLLRQGRLRLGSAHFEVQEMSAAVPRVKRPEIRVRMLSPLVAYSTLSTPDGGRFTHYYSPFEPRFAEIVGENLAKKYALIHGRPLPPDGFGIRPLHIAPEHHKVTRFKNTIIKGWMGDYLLTGPPDLLQVALDAGLGSKNSQGHGCCQLVRRRGRTEDKEDAR